MDYPKASLKKKSALFVSCEHLREQKHKVMGLMVPFTWFYTALKIYFQDRQMQRVLFDSALTFANKD